MLRVGIHLIDCLHELLSKNLSSGRINFSVHRFDGSLTVPCLVFNGFKLPLTCYLSNPRKRESSLACHVSGDWNVVLG